MGLSWSHNLGYRSKRLVRVDFGLFFKTFFSQNFFRFAIYGVIPILRSRSCVWFVHLGWLLSSLEDFFISFFNIFLYTFCFWKFILHWLRKWCFIVAIATLFYFSATLKISFRSYIFLLMHMIFIMFYYM
jgi:hypothetical protein